jgi:hypothetical protein
MNLPNLAPFGPDLLLAREIKAKIEERLRNVPEANRERAFINAAKTEAMNHTVRPNGVRV